MPDRDELAERLVAFVTTLARGGERWAIRGAVLVTAAALVTYLLGLAALDGSAEQVWAVIGAAIGLAAIGVPLLAAWRLRAVRRRAPELVGDVRTLMGRNRDAERLVIETVESGQPTGDRSMVVYRSQDFGDLQRIAVSTGDLRVLPDALTAVRSYPGLLVIGVLAILGFGFLSFVFLVALAL
jgi:hypothetical protein